MNISRIVYEEIKRTHTRTRAVSCAAHEDASVKSGANVRPRPACAIGSRDTAVAATAGPCTRRHAQGWPPQSSSSRSVARDGDDRSGREAVAWALSTTTGCTAGSSRHDCLHPSMRSLLSRLSRGLCAWTAAVAAAAHCPSRGACRCC